MYAVVDVETTGLDPRRDRVIDICAVLLDVDGKTEQVLSSLVKVWPLPPTAPSAAYEHAPEFWEIADELVAALSGRVLVGQNVQFDRQLLQAEFIRFGVTMSCDAAYDTLAGDKRLHPKVEGSRSLHLIARRLELEERSWHTAEGDALATADLFRYQLATDYLRESAAKKSRMEFAGDLPGNGKPMVPRDPEQFGAVSKLPKVWTPEELEWEPDDSGPRGPVVIDSPELRSTIDDLISKINARPEVRERKRLQDEALAAAGAMGREEAYDLVEASGRLKTREQRKELEAAAVTMEIIGDKEGLIAALFRIAKMGQGHGDIDEADAALLRIKGLFEGMDDSELEEHCYSAARIAEWGRVRDILDALAPAILKDEDDGPGVIFQILYSEALDTAEYSGAADGLRVLDRLERLVPRGSIDEIELRQLRWDVLWRGKSPDAVAYGLECWELGMGNDHMVAEAIKSMAADGEVRAAVELGRRALETEPESRRIRAALGKIQRELDKL